MGLGRRSDITHEFSKIAANAAARFREIAANQDGHI